MMIKRTTHNSNFRHLSGHSFIFLMNDETFLVENLSCNVDSNVEENVNDISGAL